MATQEEKDQVMKAMDEAALVAAEELKTMDAEAVITMSAWWAKNYLKAGHKRLGRVLVAVNKTAKV